MGEIMKIRCSTCREEWECMTGCGLQHGRKENIIAAFQSREQAQIYDWIRKSRIPLYDFGYQIASCRFCNDLVSIPVLRGIEDDEVFVGICPVCGGQIQQPLPKDIANIACPACGGMSLESVEIGHWD